MNGPAPHRLAIEDVGMMRAGNETRKGDWMETWQGVRFYPLDPRPEEVLLLDVAHHLGRINRYNGACDFEHFSVAEHSVLMADWLYREFGCPLLSYQALFHDAPEAYIGDMVRPLKRNMPAFVAAEEPVWRAVVRAFPLLGRKGQSQVAQAGGNPEAFWAMDDRVKEADNRILVDERAQVMRPSGNPWGIDHLTGLGVTIHGMPPGEAEQNFLFAEEDYRLKAAA